LATSIWRSCSFLPTIDLSTFLQILASRTQGLGLVVDES
jgi:hypothetical protein